MTDTTSIMQLPTDPANGGSINPSFTSSNETKVEIDNSQLVSLDNSTIQQIVNGLQKASASGMTSLPSRDIPQSTEQITNDSFAHHNYIPNQEKKYELDKEEDEERIISTYEKENKRENMLEYYYELFQTPILIAILYFIFQLPVTKLTILKLFPVFSKPDGNLNLNGIFFSSSLFATMYFSLSQLFLQ